MKYLFPILFLLVGVNVFAQTPFAQPLLPFLSELPNTYPTSPQDAFAQCTDNNDGTYNTGKITGAYAAKIKDFQTRLLLSGMPDTSFVKNLKNMTPDQQRAWAMQQAMLAQQNAGAQTLKVPSQAETAFMMEWNRNTMLQMSFSDSLTSQWGLLLKEYDDNMKALEAKKNDAQSKCPQVQIGETEEQLPACLCPIEKQYQTDVNNYFTQWMKKAEDYIANEKNSGLARFSNTEDLLGKADYCVNPSQGAFKTSAVNFQNFVLTFEAALGQMVSDVWGKATNCQEAINASKAKCK